MLSSSGWLFVITAFMAVRASSGGLRCDENKFAVTRGGGKGLAVMRHTSGARASSAVGAAGRSKATRR